MQPLTLKSDCTRFSCEFIEKLLKKGPEVTQNWFEIRADDPKNQNSSPCDFNGWSQVAKRVANAARKEIIAGNQYDALAFGNIACSIYESILPLMKDELDIMGFGGIGFDITQVEAIDIRIQLLNRFGPQKVPFKLDVSTIETWFFNIVEQKCLVDVHNLDNSEKFNQEVQVRCIKSHIKVICRLNDQLLSPKLKNWVQTFETIPS